MEDGQGHQRARAIPNNSNVAMAQRLVTCGIIMRLLLAGVRVLRLIDFNQLLEGLRLYAIMTAKLQVSIA